jgi:CRISPR-associated protein Cas5d
MNDRFVSVRVKGDFACFTRPENKVERVSYPMITPSAARGVLEAIYWHPEFTWAVREIHVLAPVQTFGIFRNEVNSKMSPNRMEPYFADEDRSQRFSVCLRDVDYLIFADANPKPGIGENHGKYRDIFRRRVERGQCYHRPALGCREFAADFGPPDDAPNPIDWTADLGLMLHDMDYSPGKPPYHPRFFEAIVEGGVMRVPDHMDSAAKMEEARCQ